MVDITSIALSDCTISATNVTYTITFSLPTALIADDSIIVTIPATANVGGAGSSGNTITGGGVVTFVRVTGQNVILKTDGAVDAATPQTILITGITNASSASADIGIDLITQNSSSTTKDTDDTATPIAVKIIGTLAESTGGTGANAFTGIGSATQRAIYPFKLTAAGENATIDSIKFPLSTLTGVSTGEITNAKIYVDANGDGLKDGGDVTQVGGSGTVSATPDLISFTTAFTVTSGTGTNYILVGDVANLLDVGDVLGVTLSNANVFSRGATSTLSITASGSIGPKLNTEVAGVVNVTATSMTKNWISASANSVTVAFTTVHNIPVGGDILVTFPSGSTVTAATLGGGSSFTGGGSATITARSGLVVTLTTNTAVLTPGSQTIILDNITNSSSVNNNTTLDILSRNVADVTIDNDDVASPITFNIVGTLTVGTATTPITTNNLSDLSGAGGSNVAITSFKLTATGEDITVDTLWVTPYFYGMLSAEISAINIYRDNDGNGQINGADAAVTTGSVDESGSGVTRRLHLTGGGGQTVITATPRNYIVVASFTDSIDSRDSIRINVRGDTASNFLGGSGATTSSQTHATGSLITGNMHVVTGHINADQITLASRQFKANNDTVTIKYTTRSELTTGDKYVVTFPPGFHLGAVGVSSTTVTKSGSDPTLNAGASDSTIGKLVFNVAAPEPRGQQILVLKGITNPDTAWHDSTIKVYSQLSSGETEDSIDLTPATYDVVGTVTTDSSGFPIRTNNLAGVAGFGIDTARYTNFTITVAGEPCSLLSVQVTPTLIGMTTGEVSNFRLFYDNGTGGGTANNNIIDGGEGSVLTAPVDDAGSGNPITLTCNPLYLNVGTHNFIVTGKLLSSVSPGDSLRLDIGAASAISAKGKISDTTVVRFGNAITGFQHPVTASVNIISASLYKADYSDTVGMIIQFTTYSTIPAAGDEIVVTFPGVLNISKINVDIHATHFQSGTYPTIDWSKSADSIIVLNVAAPEPSGTHQLTFSYIITPSTVKDSLILNMSTRRDNGVIIDIPDENPPNFDVVGRIRQDSATTPIRSNNIQNFYKVGGFNIPITNFKLTASGENARLTQIVVFPTYKGMTSSEISNIRIYKDNGSGGGTANNGNIDGSESPINTRVIDDSGSGHSVTIPVEDTVYVGSPKQYIVTASFDSTVGVRDTFELEVGRAAFHQIKGITTKSAPVITAGDPVNSIKHNVRGLELILSTGDSTIKETQTLTINTTSKYTEGRIITYDTLQAARGVRFDTLTNTLTWSPDLTQLGSYLFGFSVRDGILTDTKYVRVTVNNSSITGGDLVNSDTSTVRSDSGGTVRVHGGGGYTRHQVFIPRNALPSSETIIVKRPSTDKLPQTELEDVPSAVEFYVVSSPDSFRFRDTLDLTVEYKDFEILHNQAHMRVHWWDPIRQRWIRIFNPYTVDSTNHTITTGVTHFTVFGAIEVPETTRATSFGPNWNMIAVPVEPTAITNPGSIFAPSIKPFRFEEANSSIYKFNENTNSWGLPTVIENATGYIVWNFENSASANITGLHVQGDKTKTLTFTRNNGWNLVGNPFSVAVNWDTQVSKTNVNSIYYYWNGTQYVYYPGGGGTASIPAGRGFFVKAGASGASLEFRYPASSSKSTKYPTDSFDWRIQLIASVGDIVDTYNFAGVSNKANPVYDEFDAYELFPLSSDYVSLYFPHKEWKDNPANYTQDIRPMEGDTIEWQFEVMSNIKGKDAVLTWNLPEQFPEGYSVKLIDLDVQSKAIDIKEIKEYSYALAKPKNTGKEAPPDPLVNVNNPAIFPKNTGLETRHFILRVIKPQSRPAIPETYYLKQNYPNPFNPVTTIEYALPEQTDVQITIYNVLGQEVRNLLKAQQTPGVYKILWDSRNNSGIRVTSGIYFYRIKAGNFIQTKKMMLLK